MKLSKDSWSVVGATLALLVYGALQERVMTRSYGTGSNKELFPHSAFLVLCNRMLTVLALVVHSRISGLSFVPVAPVHAYCLVSASNMLSTLCQYEALKYVSFVTQTLAKTSKALPVVLWGTLVGGRRYRTEQYIHAVLVTAGCSVFVLGGDISSAAAAAHRGAGSWLTYGVGMVLLLVYLAADGWTSTQQEHLFKAYNTCVREQLLYTTAFSALYSLVATVGGGQLLPAVAFLLRHPSAAAAVLGLSVMSTVIQVCISHVLQQHGALVFALMMTTRQCASVLLSSLLFGHTLTLSQWLGVAVVFSALYHQKAGKLTHRRRSTAGRLPQSRESAAGAAAALLPKQPPQPQQQAQQQAPASGVRGVYSSRVSSHAGALPPAGGTGGTQGHAAHSHNSSLNQQQQQQHHVRQVKGEPQGGAAVRGVSSSGHVLQPVAARPEAAVVAGGALQQQGAPPRMHSRSGAAAPAGLLARCVALRRCCRSAAGAAHSCPAACTACATTVAAVRIEEATRAKQRSLLVVVEQPMLWL
ncbi:UAA transporter family-domain-containing protein [Scenedesmus sp. NREL 46B-D3]|nr:UAA transporter family-domain-containing protein [Scenedesmus sp. NREL 46B-D3]